MRLQCDGRSTVRCVCTQTIEAGSVVGPFGREGRVLSHDQHAQDMIAAARAGDIYTYANMVLKRLIVVVGCPPMFLVIDISRLTPTHNDPVTFSRQIQGGHENAAVVLLADGFSAVATRTIAKDEELLIGRHHDAHHAIFSVLMLRELEARATRTNRVLATRAQLLGHNHLKLTCRADENGWRELSLLRALPKNTNESAFFARHVAAGKKLALTDTEAGLSLVVELGENSAYSVLRQLELVLDVGICMLNHSEALDTKESM